MKLKITFIFYVLLSQGFSFPYIYIYIYLLDEGYVDDYLFDGEYLLLGEDGTVVTTDGFPMCSS